MPDPSQIRTKEGRGGLSRSAAKAVNAARQKHADDLIRSIFGSDSQAQHFKDHPLDGGGTLEAMPVPGQVPSRREAVPTMSAADPVKDTADWFKGGKGEGDKRSAPNAARSPKPKAPDVLKAIEEAQVGLQVQRTFDVEVPVGVTGGDYQVALDVLERPPNTEMF